MSTIRPFDSAPAASAHSALSARAARCGLLSTLLFAGALLMPSTSRALESDDLGVVETTTSLSEDGELLTVSMRARGGSIELSSEMACAEDDAGLICGLIMVLDQDLCEVNAQGDQGTCQYELAARIGVIAEYENITDLEVLYLKDPGGFTRDDASASLLEQLIERNVGAIATCLEWGWAPSR